MKFPFNIKFIICMSILLVFSCSIIGKTGKKKTQETIAIDYIAHFERGKSAYKEGQFNDAEAELKNCLLIRPQFIPALEMLGLIYLDNGNLVEAQQQFSQALVQNAYSVQSRMGMGHLYIHKGEYEKAVAEFDIALSVDSTNTEAYLYKGMTLRKMGSSYLSATSLIRAVLTDSAFRSTVAGIIPLTDARISNLFKKEYLTIENKSQISRADAAALISTIITDERAFNPIEPVGSLKSPKNYEKPLQHFVISDVSDTYWARSEIYKVVKSRLIELFPDSTFKPELEITKTEFAYSILKISARITNNPELGKKYTEQSSPFLDFNNAHWAYIAIRYTTELKLLKPREPNIFGIKDPISGKMAISALEKVH